MVHRDNSETNPCKADTDGDGLNDDFEINCSGCDLDPTEVDSDDPADGVK